MNSGWAYRVGSTGGALIAAAAAVFIANTVAVQLLVTTYVPLVNRLPITVLSGHNLALAVILSAGIVFGCLIPMYKPRPRRSLDTILLTQKRVLAAMFALATLGYFNWSYRLPRATLGVTMGLLLIILPAWFATLQKRLTAGDDRTIIVGTDPYQIERILSTADLPVVGYLAPPVLRQPDAPGTVPVADGGSLATVPNVERLGGLSRLEEILVQYDIKTVFLAFADADRGEFFGALATCHKHGVRTKVPKEHKESVLHIDDDSEERMDEELIAVNLEPWDWQDRLLKRTFDLLFAGGGLLILSPVMVVIAVTIKLDDSGPILYSQDRTAGLGGTFRVYKFRSMVTNAEDEHGAVISAEDAGETDPRVTEVGRILRKTHMDEIPQLWSILGGDMSVVGPRPERPELDSTIQANGVEWEKRWFVKPGLTGLAQVNNATGFEPKEKLKWDLQYIRHQSFWFDMRIVIRQVWAVLHDIYEFVQLRGASK